MSKFVIIFTLFIALVTGTDGVGLLAATPESVGKSAQTQAPKRKVRPERQNPAQPVRPEATAGGQAVAAAAPDLNNLVSSYCATLNATSSPFLLRAPSFDEPDYERLLPEDMRVKFRFEIEKRIDPLTNRELPAPKFKFDLSDPKETLKALSGSMEIRILDF